MKKSKKSVVVTGVCLSLALAMAVGFSFNSAKDVKASSLKTKSSVERTIKGANSRIAISKCAIELEANSFDWTGKAVEPGVTVNYQGTVLKKGQDFVVEYKNNIDAGRARVKVIGKGKYRGSDTVYFDIVGIDFRTECDVVITNKNEVVVYYQGKKLDEKNYYVNVLKQEFLKSTIETPNGNLNTYEVTYYYTVSGKGQFSGAVSKTVTKSEMRYE